LASPSWSASIRQVPTASKVTVAPAMVQTEDVEESMLKVTGFPDSPPTPDTV